jgi:hypothetical protein
LRLAYLDGERPGHTPQPTALPSDALHGNAARMFRERLEVVDFRREDSAVWFSQNHRYDIDGRAAAGSIS